MIEIKLCGLELAIVEFMAKVLKWDLNLDDFSISRLAKPNATWNPMNSSDLGTHLAYFVNVHANYFLHLKYDRKGLFSVEQSLISTS